MQRLGLEIRINKSTMVMVFDMQNLPFDLSSISIWTVYCETTCANGSCFWLFFFIYSMFVLLDSCLYGTILQTQNAKQAWIFFSAVTDRSYSNVLPHRLRVRHTLVDGKNKWAMKKTPGCVLYIGNEFLSTYMGIINKLYYKIIIRITIKQPVINGLGIIIICP